MSPEGPCERLCGRVLLANIGAGGERKWRADDATASQRAEQAGNRAQASRKGLLLLRAGRQAGFRSGNPAAHQGSGHPAGVEEGVDLAASERPHPGRRRRRRRAPAVPLPLRLAGRTRRGEVRPGAGTFDAASRLPRRDRQRPCAPGLDPQAGAGARAAPARPWLLPAGGEQYAEEHESYGLSTLLCEHVVVRRDAVEFDFPARAGFVAPWKSRTPTWSARCVR